MTRDEFLTIIRNNINANGYHITLVNGGQNPDFSYSIGLSENLGFELVIAGGFDSIKKNEAIFGHIYQSLKSGVKVDSHFSLSDNEIYYLDAVDSSWAENLMLGVCGYYRLNKIKAYQIVPAERTLDVPLMSNELNTNDPIWKWLLIEWNINAPKNSYVITDLNALKGKTITEAMKWEDHVWEMFSEPGPDVKKEDIRIVPLGTILGIDATLNSIIDLSVEQGLWRDDKDSSWQNW